MRTAARYDPRCVCPSGAHNLYRPVTFRIYGQVILAANILRVDRCGCRSPGAEGIGDGLVIAVERSLIGGLKISDEIPRAAERRTIIGIRGGQRPAVDGHG